MHHHHQPGNRSANAYQQSTMHIRDQLKYLIRECLQPKGCKEGASNKGSNAISQTPSRMHSRREQKAQQQESLLRGEDFKAEIMLKDSRTGTANHP
jgi:hypothetical protein